MATESPPHSAKEAALDRVLASAVLARASQLRNFLKYVCVAEMEGRGAALNEYLVGVEALGRSPKFSPGEDAIVRNRAHALRQRLDEYYRVEGLDDPVRIELPRGSYCPRFLIQAVPPPVVPAALQAAVLQSAVLQPAPAGALVPFPAGQEQPDPALPPPTWPAPANVALDAAGAGAPSVPSAAGLHRAAYLWPIWSALMGALVGAGLVLLWLAGAPSTSAQDEARAASRLVSMFWGPLLEPGANVLVSVAAPAQVLLRAIDGEPPKRMWQPIPHLEAWFRETSPSPVSDAARVYLFPTWSSPMWGDAMSAMTLVPVLARAGVSYTTMPQRVLTLQATRGRNLVVIGNPELSPIARHYLASTPYTIAYDAVQREWGIVPTAAHPQGGSAPRFFLQGEGNDVAHHTFGLITSVPSEGTVANEKRTLLISGLGSSGTQAAAEFVASAAELALLADHMGLDDRARPPAAWQVVVETTASKEALPLTVRYRTHIAFSR